MDRRLCFVMAAAFVLIGGDRISGWGEVGHKVVGRIAASLLTPQAQQKVAQILEVENSRRAVADALAEAAFWPDAVAREAFPQANPWHFIDLGVRANPKLDDPQWESPDTAFAKLVQYFGTVKRGDEDELEPASDLEFIAHLVGDIHQPLHAATNRDRGGNCLRVRFQQADGDESRTIKFHALWDRAILEDRLGTDDKQIARQLGSRRRQVIQTELAAARTAIAGGVDRAVRRWIEVSHQLAVNTLYGSLTPTVPRFEFAEVDSQCQTAAPIYKKTLWRLDEDAVDDAIELIERQLAIGGARLAALLNAAAQ